MRCKVRLASIDVSDFSTTQQVARLLFYPVVATAGVNPENDSFFAATPGGQIDLQVVNMSAIGALEKGDEYYVDFTSAAGAVIALAPTQHLDESELAHVAHIVANGLTLPFHLVEKLWNEVKQKLGAGDDAKTADDVVPREAYDLLVEQLQRLSDRGDEDSKTIEDLGGTILANQTEIEALTAQVAALTTPPAPAPAEVPAEVTTQATTTETAPGGATETAPAPADATTTTTQTGTESAD